MNINPISTNAISNHDKTNKNSDSELNIQQLEKRKEKLKNELQDVDQSKKDSKTNSTRQKYLEKQIDLIDKKILQISKKETSKTSKLETTTPGDKYPMDEFIKNDSSSTGEFAGIYHLEKDQNGRSRITFNKPLSSNSIASNKKDESDRAGRLEKETKSSSSPVEVKDDEEKDNRDMEPEESSDKSSSAKKIRTGTVNTDKVDAEIRKLEKERQQTQQEISRAAGDDEKQAKLEKHLDEIEAELSYKDTDVYRKQHAEYSESN